MTKKTDAEQTAENMGAELIAQFPNGGGKSRYRFGDLVVSVPADEQEVWNREKGGFDIVANPMPRVRGLITSPGGFRSSIEGVSLNSQLLLSAEVSGFLVGQMSKHLIVAGVPEELKDRFAKYLEPHSGIIPFASGTLDSKRGFFGEYEWNSIAEALALKSLQTEIYFPLLERVFPKYASGEVSAKYYKDTFSVWATFGTRYVKGGRQSYPAESDADAHRVREELLAKYQPAPLIGENCYDDSIEYLNHIEIWKGFEVIESFYRLKGMKQLSEENPRPPEFQGDIDFKDLPKVLSGEIPVSWRHTKLWYPS